MKKAIWLSFDLGVNGDYEGMYAWLDSHNAEECGDSVAFLNYDEKLDVVDEVQKDIKQNIKLNNRSRIYLIHRSKEKKLRGEFIVGGRKQAPWTGYGLFDERAPSDEA